MCTEARNFIEKIISDLDGALSQNTLRAYRSDFMQLARWLESKGLPIFPITPEALVQYISEMQTRHKSATIRHRLETLRSIYFFAKLDDPTRAPEVRLALKRMHRAIGRHQQQAYPLTRDHLDKMLKKCNSTIKGRRNELLLRIGYETMRRSSEICAFRFENLKQLPDGRFALFMPFSKTDQMGEGRLIPISDLLAKRIQEWGKKIKADSGPILRSLRKGDRVSGPLGTHAISIILVDLQYHARLRHLPYFSGHSFRVGAALDLLNAGVPVEKIMLRAGWKRESTALRYLQSWLDSVNPGELNNTDEEF